MKDSASSSRGGVRMIFLWFRKRRNGSPVFRLTSNGCNCRFTIFGWPSCQAQVQVGRQDLCNALKWVHSLNNCDSTILYIKRAGVGSLCKSWQIRWQISGVDKPSSLREGKAFAFETKQCNTYGKNKSHCIWGSSNRIRTVRERRRAL